MTTKNIEDVVAEFRDFLGMGERLPCQHDYDVLEAMLTQLVKEVVAGEREQLIKYDLYGEARALDIPMDTVKKLQDALTPPTSDEENRVHGVIIGNE